MLQITYRHKLAIGGTLTLAVATAAILLLGLAGGASGQPIQVTVGNVQVTGDGDFRPKRLPAKRRAPVRLINLRGSLRNLDENGNPIDVPFPEPNPRQPVQAPAPEGSRPPIVSRIIADFDRRGSIDTRGLPVCKEAQLRNQTYMVAKRRCAGALIAEGAVNGVVDFPDQQPFVAPGNLLMFNGGPKKIIFHAWANPDVPTAFVVPARISKAPGKRFGHRITSNVPRVANDNGSLTDFRVDRVFKTWRHKGKKRSYLGARCNKPTRFAVRVRVEFRPDEAFPQAHPPMQINFTRPCKVKR
jgi:hypothetical protein